MKIEKLQSNNPEDVLYGIGLVILLIFILIFFLLKIHVISLPVPDCMFFRLTGLYCPGCGGTRAFLALLRLHILESIRYHCFVVYAVFCYLIFMIAHTIHLLSHRKCKTITFAMRYVIVGIVLLIGQFLVKNGLILFFDYYCI